jgi:hypothetical protein
MPALTTITKAEKRPLDSESSGVVVHRLVGLFADQERNALMTALRNAALTDTEGCPYSEGDRMYLYVENTPKTSLVSEMVDHLHRIGYCIKPNA